MTKKVIPALTLLGLLALTPISTQAVIMSVSNGLSTESTAAAIIAAPGSVTNATVTNTGQQGFNEKQGVFLGSALSVDGGSIAAGARVDSHMIFLNNPYRNKYRIDHFNVEWTFSGTILGVMSDKGGNLEAASTSLLGLDTTTYPAAGFRARGMEGKHDSYVIAGNVLTVNMRVTQPGDWIRVVTTSVPDAGSTVLLLGVGLLGLAAIRRRIGRSY